MSQVTELQKVKTEIRAKQSELYLLQEEGSIAVASQIEKEIDDLQKKYKNLSGSDIDKLDDIEVLPDIEGQIKFMARICVMTGAPRKFPMLKAIYESLIAANRMASIEGGMINLNKAISKLSSFTLADQREFLALLKAKVSSQAFDAKLVKMFTAFEDNINLTEWFGKAAAEYLLAFPSNQPEQKEETNLKAVDLSIDLFKEENRWVAQFDEEDALRGYGITEQEAVSNLLAGREKRKQAELFPEGGDHD